MPDKTPSPATLMEVLPSCQSLSLIDRWWWVGIHGRYLWPLAPSATELPLPPSPPLVGELVRPDSAGALRTPRRGHDRQGTGGTPGGGDYRRGQGAPHKGRTTGHTLRFNLTESFEAGMQQNPTVMAGISWCPPLTNEIPQCFSTTAKRGAATWVIFPSRI